MNRRASASTPSAPASTAAGAPASAPQGGHAARSRRRARPSPPRRRAPPSSSQCGQGIAHDHAVLSIKGTGGSGAGLSPRAGRSAAGTMMTTPAQKTPPTSCCLAEPWMPTLVLSSGTSLCRWSSFRFLRCGLRRTERQAPHIRLSTSKAIVPARPRSDQSAAVQNFRRDLKLSCGYFREKRGDKQDLRRRRPPSHRPPRHRPRATPPAPKLALDPPAVRTPQAKSKARSDEGDDAARRRGPFEEGRRVSARIGRRRAPTSCRSARARPPGRRRG